MVDYMVDYGRHHWLASARGGGAPKRMFLNNIMQAHRPCSLSATVTADRKPIFNMDEANHP